MIVAYFEYYHSGEFIDVTICLNGSHFIYSLKQYLTLIKMLHVVIHCMFYDMSA